MSAITGFFVAVGIASAALFMLMIRADRSRDRRRAYANPSTGDTTSGSDSFNRLIWFGGSSSSSSPNDACNSSSSSSDSSSCGDSGGGGGGGDGGGGGGD